MADELGRRDFLKTSAVAVAAAGALAGPARAQSDKVNIGWVGTGTRGYFVMEQMYKANAANVKVVAVCDTYTGNLARGKDRVQTLGGNTPETYNDFYKMLENKDIDTVFIMTPEHLHYPMFMAAIKAGKNIYVEKPLAHTIEQGYEMVAAWEKSGKVVQVGTQNRSSSLYKKAKEMVDQGMIGDCHFVRAFWYRNSPPDKPAWRYDIPKDANPENTDFQKFLGPAPKHAFDLRRYYQWRLYWDYSGGISTDLLVHQTDITNFVLGKTVPVTCAASGGRYRWLDKDDDRDVPDTFSAIYEYPDNFEINYSCYFGNDHYGYGEQFMGNEGTIEVLNRKDLYFYPEQHSTEAARARPEVHLNGPKDFGEQDGVTNHVKNFIESVRGNEKVIAPPTVGQQAAISGHLATLSFKANKKVLWDDKARKYHFT
jgi:predicted dehydrogenase